MATAERKVERRVIEDVAVTLTMSPEEAYTLRAVLRAVGGPRGQSPRRHVASMLDALYKAGISLPMDAEADPFGPRFHRPQQDDSKAPHRLLVGTLKFNVYPEA